jgi:hypothetical protein
MIQHLGIFSINAGTLSYPHTDHPAEDYFPSDDDMPDLVSSSDDEDDNAPRPQACTGRQGYQEGPGPWEITDNKAPRKPLLTTTFDVMASTRHDLRLRCLLSTVPQIAHPDENIISYFMTGATAPASENGEDHVYGFTFVDEFHRIITSRVKSTRGNQDPAHPYADDPDITIQAEA